MGKVVKFTAALAAAFGLTTAGAQDEAPVAPFAPPLVQQCQQLGQWHSLPTQDFSSMALLGKKICTDQPFTTVLPEANDNRDKYFAQLTLAERELTEKLRLGRAIQSGELKNVPNMFVTQKPYGADGAVVYTFQLTVRRPLAEAGLALIDEQTDGQTKRGIMTGLIQVPTRNETLAKQAALK